MYSFCNTGDTKVSVKHTVKASITTSTKTTVTASQKVFGPSGASSEAKPVANAEKPLLRRKSELPTDQFTQNALESHKRADEYLTTPPPDSN